ncbi:glycosyltransferase family 2 protein [Zooshikella harenae]|uniref:Glycosyltransferase n=1 Tax=Zooshikella harenae TaxID=2827238 RepID=A0ABS5ZCD8_9GAMM|nr:glycosyltransferase family 2 protein [Zooshikella harenae]MBU2711722.1 glycosyltransferase [Zooshikella harenae]
MKNFKQIHRTSKPLISIITVCYNAVDFIESTFISIKEQNFQDYEYIVIDGGSSDGTLEVIQKHQDIIDYWQTEPDQGIADAMNKGLGHAQGAYILFLHADDYFHTSNSLSVVADFMKKKPGYDVYACNILYGSNPNLSLQKPRGFNAWINIKTGIFHQGALCKKTLFDTIGLFDTHFKIAMDYDWFLRAYLKKASLKKTYLVLTVMRDTGISSKTDQQSLLNRFTEEKKVHEKNCCNSLWHYIYLVWWLIYPKYRLFFLAIKNKLAAQPS